MKKILIITLIFYSTALSAAGTEGKYDNSTPTNVDFHRAVKMINNDNFDQALKVLLDIESKKPLGYTKADLYNYLGYCSRKKSNPDFEKAEYYYNKSLDLDAKHVGALEYLGELYYETNELEKALVMLDRLEASAGKDSDEYQELYELLNN